MIIKIYDKIKKYGFLEILSFFIRKKKEKYKQKKIKKGIKFLKIFEINNYIPDIIFFYDDTDNISKEKIKSFYDTNKEIKNKVITDAESILQHNFDLLGSGKIKLRNEIPWNMDFKNLFIWENKFYNDIKIIDLDNKADVKIPWELSRFQHLFTLGKAYWITDNRKYYEEGRKEILDWLEKNPVYYSVNWTCSMEVAIRAVNWIFFYFLFKSLINSEEEFLKKLNNSLYEHGEYIYSNLEKSLGFSNNHYLANLTGLIFIGLYFKKLNLKKINNWLFFSIKEFEKEIIIQNYEDGANYETSTSYHRLVTELAFFPALLLNINNLSFSEKYLTRLEKMFEFMFKIIKPNGKIPLIGDVDNGRLVILSNYYDWEPNDVRDTISLGGEFFNNIFLKKVASKALEEKLWIFNNTEVYEETLPKKSFEFKKGGYYILRNVNFYCMVRCGNLSLNGQGGHSHNDQLSIELNVKGKDFFVDTGTGVYTSDKKLRNFFRSTFQHNTVIVKGYEQNNFFEDILFLMPEETFSKCLDFKENYFKGEHYGYLNKINLVHQREISLEMNKVIIKDFLNGGSGEVVFILDNNVKIKEKNNFLILERGKQKIILKIDKNSLYRISNSFLSYKYGEIKNTTRISIKFKNKNKTEIIIQ